MAVLKLIFYEHDVSFFPALIVFACNDQDGQAGHRRRRKSFPSGNEMRFWPFRHLFDFQRRLSSR
ncbi:hypothetical protein [Rhizobium leucaenae]|uniref:Uncharacterized protein n=1 Tax=Rhizobium leucaenae TaxID=29450 RepID=A0A7W6ZWA7_9HYPH|nr:hypothetical protein [Rhizobium leucaenae]MBB4569901.1 hypothetical protein [Rhizobium leucaenae]MBB6299586.1 hypothetical protein [Rhizobium leucaenae]